MAHYQDIFSMDTWSLEEMFAPDRQYIVPPFQREYSWGKPQWEDLFNDFIKIVNEGESDSYTNNNNTHFLGNIILSVQHNNVSTVQNRKFDRLLIIDGQQRLTSCIILLLALISQMTPSVEISSSRLPSSQEFNRYANKFPEVAENLLIMAEKEKQARQQARHGQYDKFLYIDNSFDSFVYNDNLRFPKLVLSQDSNDHFVNYFLGKKFDKLQNDAITYFSGGTENMRQAFLYFIKKIQLFIEPCELRYHQYSLLIHDLLRNFFFVVMYPSKLDNAYTIFETLNTRGLSLSIADLIKNHLLCLLDNSGQLEFGLDIWNQILQTVKYEQIHEFCIQAVKSCHKITPNENFFKLIREFYNTANKALEFLEYLLNLKDIYVALQDPSSEYWKAKKGHFTNNISDKAIVTTLQTLTNTVHSKEYIPLCLAISQSNNLKKHLNQILTQIILPLFIRCYGICQKNPHSIESGFNQLSVQIYNKDITNLTTFLTKLHSIQLDISDAEFVTLFSQLKLNEQSQESKNFIKYILQNIECVLKENPLWNAEYYSIEHIVSKNILLNNSQDYFSQASNMQSTASINMNLINNIGNLTLLEPNINNLLGTKHINDISKKSTYYKKSNVLLTKKMFQIVTWKEYCKTNKKLPKTPKEFFAQISNNSNIMSDTINNENAAPEQLMIARSTWLANKAVEIWQINWQISNKNVKTDHEKTTKLNNPK